MPDRIGTVGHFQLILDGVTLGFLKSVEGGSPVAAVVAEKPDSSLIPRKRLGSISYSPIVMQCAAASPVLCDWINASWTGKPQQKDGSIVSADMNLRAVSQQDFVHALVTETTFPALDGSSKDPAHLTVTLAPELTRDAEPSGTVTGEPVKQKNWLSSNFRVAIDGLDCKHVMRVDALTVKQAIVSADARRPGRQPGPLEFPNLTITTSQADAETWFAWFEDFALKGNNGQSKEKSGLIALLSPDLKEDLLRIDLFGLGIFAIGPDRGEAGSGTIATVTAQMYCERMELHPPGRA